MKERTKESYQNLNRILGLKNNSRSRGSGRYLTKDGWKDRRSEFKVGGTGV